MGAYAEANLTEYKSRPRLDRSHACNADALELLTLMKVSLEIGQPA